MSGAAVRCKECGRLCSQGRSTARGLCSTCIKRTEVLKRHRAPTSPPYSYEEERRLRRLTESGWSAKEVAARLGRTAKAVAEKRFKMGLTKKRTKGA